MQKKNLFFLKKNSKAIKTISNSFWLFIIGNLAVPRAVHAAVVVNSLVLLRRRNRVAFLLLLLFLIRGIVVAVPLFFLLLLLIFVLLLVGRIGVGLILIFLFLLLGLFLLLALPPEMELYVYKTRFENALAKKKWLASQKGKLVLSTYRVYTSSQYTYTVHSVLKFKIFRNIP